MGGAVVRGLCAAGARVIVPTRTAVSPGHASRDDVGGVSAERGTDADGGAGPGGPTGALRTVTVRTWEDPVELLAVAAEPGWAPDAVVAAIGGWWIGTELMDLSPLVWRELVESHLTGHFLVARALAPLIAGTPDAVYVALNGAAAREPMALSGPVSVAGAGQSMLLDVLRRESIGRTVRFHELLVLAAVAGDDRNLTPVATVAPGAVAAAALGVLCDPAAPPTVQVGATGDLDDRPDTGAGPS